MCVNSTKNYTIVKNEVEDVLVVVKIPADHFAKNVVMVTIVTIKTSLVNLVTVTQLDRRRHNVPQMDDVTVKMA